MKTYNGYIIKPAPVTPQHVVIVTEGKGGKIPKVLEGIFTSYTVAMTQIDEYLKSKV